LLEAGARVADVGCGKGASTILMAKAFPKSRFFGFDYHDKSIEAARNTAKRDGVADRATFEVAKAKEYPGKDYDFVAVFKSKLVGSIPTAPTKNPDDSVALALVNHLPDKTIKQGVLVPRWSQLNGSQLASG
jgi:precorrin-6B methylase 2